jgi:DNA polymerase
MTQTYQEILRSVGYPEDILVVDFESFYDTDYSLTKMSTIEYICDPRWGCLGLGALFFDKSGLFPFWVEPGHIKAFNNSRAWNEHTVVVNNAFFDITVLKEKYGIVPKYIIDIKDLAKHYDARMSHKLKDLAKMYKLPPKGDTAQFKGLHWKDFTPELKQAMCDYNKTDLMDIFEMFKILLPLLTNPETELKLARHTLDLYLNPRIKFNVEKAKDLQADMIVEELHVVQESGATGKELSGNKSFVELLTAALPADELIPMKQGKNGNIPALAKNDEGLKYLLAHPDEKVRNLVRGRQAVKSWPLHIKRVENLGKQAAVSGGLLRIPLNYYGGHTGRWGGTEKINPQNFGGKGHGKGTHALIRAVRELLCAPEGTQFIIADSAQIEARILAWLSGQNDLLEGFKNGEDIYSRFATLLFGTEVRKSVETDNDTDRKTLDVRRGFGKDAILGCGFGMGGKKFYQRCLENDELRPIFDSGEFNFDFIDSLIKTYRRTYSRIPDFWTAVEKCFKEVIKYPNQPISILSDNIDHWPGIAIDPAIKNALLSFWNHNGTVNLQLPSGRVLYYRHTRLNNEGQIKWQWGNLWGGSITENIVQAVARDLLGYWILELEKAKLPVVLHSHDEVVILSDLPKMGLRVAKNIMKSKPAWAEGLPLDVEGVISDVYKK